MTDEELDKEIKALEERKAKLIKMRSLRRDVAIEERINKLPAIVHQACKVFGKSVGQVLSRRKTQDIVQVRWAIFRVAKAIQLSPEKIAREMKLDSGTVYHGIQSCEELMPQNKDYAAKVRALEAACENSNT